MPRMLRTPKTRYVTEVPDWLYQWARGTPLEGLSNNANVFFLLDLYPFGCQAKDVRRALLKVIEEGTVSVGPDVELEYEQLQALRGLLDSLALETLERG